MMKFCLTATAFVAFATTGSAGAADIPIKAPAPLPVSEVFSWTGFYIGVQGGSAWGTSDHALTGDQVCTPICGPFFPLPPDIEASTLQTNGMFAGATAGFNWQTGPMVFGVEGDFSGANIEAQESCTNSFGTHFSGIGQATCLTRLRDFATVAGRVGFAVDRALLFVKAGGAWGQFDHSFSAAQFTPLASAALSENRNGFVVGTGLEYNIWKGWSAKVEYNYVDFGTKNLVYSATGPIISPFVRNVAFDDHERVHLVRAGLNWRFDWFGPVIAKY